MVRIVVFFAVFILVSWRVEAQEPTPSWNTTFPSNLVGQKLVGTQLKIMVAASGEQIVEAKAAAKALVTALRADSRAKLVMTDEALGDLAALDDASIVTKSQTYGVNYTYVVRVFESGQAGAFSVVATVYDAGGTVVDGMTGEKGAPIAASSPASSPAPDTGGGVSNATSEIVSEVTGASSTDRETAEGEYALRFVWFENWVAINANNGAVAARWSVPYKGKYKEPLEGRKFYEYLNRPDLAKRYFKRSVVKWSVFGGGGVVMLGGLGVMMAGVFKKTTFFADYTYCDETDYMDSEFDDCREAVDNSVEIAGRNASSNKKTLIITGGVLTGVGTAAVVAASFINRHPVKADEAYRIVDWFNKDLKEDLGLPADFTVPESARLKPRPKPTLDVLPVVAGQDSSLTLQMNF